MVSRRTSITSRRGTPQHKMTSPSDQPAEGRTDQRSSMMPVLRHQGRASSEPYGLEEEDDEA